MPPHRLALLLTLVRRSVATASAALVFALGLFAVCPALHQQLHHGGDIPLEDGCVVVHFATGVAVAVPLVAPAPPPATDHAATWTAPIEILLTCPRYLLQPERGPPSA